MILSICDGALASRGRSEAHPKPCEGKGRLSLVLGKPGMCRRSSCCVPSLVAEVRMGMNMAAANYGSSAPICLTALGVAAVRRGRSQDFVDHRNNKIVSDGDFRGG